MPGDGGVPSEKAANPKRPPILIKYLEKDKGCHYNRERISDLSGRDELWKSTQGPDIP